MEHQDFVLRAERAFSASVVLSKCPRKRRLVFAWLRLPLTNLLRHRRLRGDRGAARRKSACHLRDRVDCGVTGLSYYGPERDGDGVRVVCCCFFALLSSSAHFFSRILLSTTGGSYRIRPVLQNADWMEFFTKVFFRIEDREAWNSTLLKLAHPSRIASSIASAW